MKETSTDIFQENQYDIISLARVITQNGRLAHFEKGQILFSHNTPAHNLFWLHEGLIKLHRNNNKQQCSLLKIEGENGFAGLSDCFNNQNHELTATAITRVEATVIDFQVLNEIIENNPHLAKLIIEIIARESRYYLQRLTTRLHKQLPGRVADTLLYFYKMFGENNTFELPLSRSELAQFAGTTKESFIRTLTEFKNDRIINIDDRSVEINSLEIVRTLSRLG